MGFGAVGVWGVEAGEQDVEGTGGFGIGGAVPELRRRVGIRGWRLGFGLWLEFETFGGFGQPRLGGGELLLNVLADLLGLIVRGKPRINAEVADHAVHGPFRSIVLTLIPGET